MNYLTCYDLPSVHTCPSSKTQVAVQNQQESTSHLNQNERPSTSHSSFQPSETQVSSIQLSVLYLTPRLRNPILPPIQRHSNPTKHTQQERYNESFSGPNPPTQITTSPTVLARQTNIQLQGSTQPLAIVTSQQTQHLPYLPTSVYLLPPAYTSHRKQASQTNTIVYLPRYLPTSLDTSLERQQPTPAQPIPTQVQSKPLFTLPSLLPPPYSASPKNA